jgi:hypothetical protein
MLSNLRVTSSFFIFRGLLDISLRARRIHDPPEIITK